MAFFQAPPELDPSLESDRLLVTYLARTLPPDMLRAIRPELTEAAALAAGPLYRAQLEQRLDEPKLVTWDAWGHRVDRIELVPLWKTFATIAAEKGLIAIPYERASGEHARVHQFALAYLLNASSGLYLCPLAMTDGAATTLLRSGNRALIDRAVPRLTSRDPKRAWTSGQWMTERTGGSDVGLTETIAREDANGFRLYGTKWFTSATTSEMALTLARPEDANGSTRAGGAGLAMFYIEMRDDAGQMNGIAIHRLKDKLGTRMLPTAELSLDGARATLVSSRGDGIKNITPMLQITRTWNAIAAISGMRRAVALAEDYANRRVAFGAKLADKPLHADTLLGIRAEAEGAFLLAFRVVELLGREEAKTITEDEASLARVLVPLAKLATGKQAVAVASEALEAFGGAGYVEDTGLPMLLRDAQVLPIWEGTTNVLALDVLRAFGRGAPFEAIAREVATRVANPARDCEAAARTATNAIAHAQTWLAEASAEGPHALETGARRFALTLARSVELALLVDHATWSQTHAAADAPHFTAIARRFAANGVDAIA